MVRLVPTADPEILLFTPADQLAQLNKLRGSLQILPRKSLLPKKPSWKAAHPCKDRHSQFSLQQEIQSGSGFPSFFQPELLHREFKSLPSHQGVMTTWRRAVWNFPTSLLLRKPQNAGPSQHSIPSSKLPLHTFLPTTLDSSLTHCAHCASPLVSFPLNHN